MIAIRSLRLSSRREIAVFQIYFLLVNVDFYLSLSLFAFSTIYKRSFASLGDKVDRLFSHGLDFLRRPLFFLSFAFDTSVFGLIVVLRRKELIQCTPLVEHSPTQKTDSRPAKYQMCGPLQQVIPDLHRTPPRNAFSFRSDIPERRAPGPSAKARCAGYSRNREP